MGRGVAHHSRNSVTARAVTHLCPSLCPRLRVHVLRVSRPAKHRNRARCARHNSIVYITHAHKFAFSIVTTGTYPGYLGSSSQLFTLPSRKLVLLDDYTFSFPFLFLSLPPRNAPHVSHRTTRDTHLSE